MPATKILEILLVGVTIATRLIIIYDNYKRQKENPYAQFYTDVTDYDKTNRHI